MEENREREGKKKSLWKSLVTVLAVILFVRFVLPLFLPFVLAYFLAELLAPAARWLKKNLHIPVSVGGAALILITLFTLGLGLFFFLRLFCRQVLAFSENFESFRAAFLGCAHTICGCVDRWFCLDAGTSEAFVLRNLPKAERMLREDTLTALFENKAAIVRFFAGLFTETIVTFAAAVLFLGYRERQEKRGEKDALLAKADKMKHRLYAAGAAYLKTELLLTILIAVLCSIGLLFVKRDYALVLGILVAVLDAFPVIGSGCVLVPWSILCLVQGHPGQAGILIVTYVACIIVREVLEPRLLGDKIGIPPLYTLMAVYLGVKLFGIFGVILGPLCLVMLRYETD